MKSLIPYLPSRLRLAVERLPSEAHTHATELRLRLDAPLSVTLRGKNLCFDAQGRYTAPPDGYRCDKAELDTCVDLLTRSSLYCYGEYVAKGYIPFGNGGRAGICGEAIVKDGRVEGFRSIWGINLRVRRFVADFGLAAARRIAEKGLCGALVYSPPDRGKTTLLSSVAYLLSTGALGKVYRVAVADERGELFVPQLRQGLADGMWGVPKAQAIELLCRSMSPQVIVCDELAPEDALPLSQVLGTGVTVLASAHGGSRDELLRRPFIRSLLDMGAFPLLVGIGADYSYRVEEYP